MLRLLKRLKAAEWLQALVSLVFIVTQVWLDLKLPDSVDANPQQRDI